MHLTEFLSMSIKEEERKEDNYHLEVFERVKEFFRRYAPDISFDGIQPLPFDTYYLKFYIGDVPVYVKHDNEDDTLGFKFLGRYEWFPLYRDTNIDSLRKMFKQACELAKREQQLGEMVAAAPETQLLGIHHFIAYTTVTVVEVSSTGLKFIIRDEDAHVVRFTVSSDIIRFLDVLIDGGVLTQNTFTVSNYVFEDLVRTTYFVGDTSAQVDGHRSYNKDDKALYDFLKELRNYYISLQEWATKVSIELDTTPEYVLYLL